MDPFWRPKSVLQVLIRFAGSTGEIIDPAGRGVAECRLPRLEGVLA